MRALFLLLAAAAIAGVSALESDESGYEDYGGTTTLIPCPGECNKETMPTCARDQEGRLYRFRNPCRMRMCACRMWMRQVPLEQCPDEAPDCPLNEGREAVSASDESSDESQSSADADSTRWAHLQENSIRLKPVFV